jgi:glycolate oxidase
MPEANFILQLKAIVGDEDVISHPEDLLVYEYDGSVDRSIPRAVVFPSSTDEVSRVLDLAYRAGVPVVGRGSGTGLSGGAIAPEGGIQIAFTRMNHILAVDLENRTATIEPGVINLDLDNHVRKFGMRYAPDPSSQKACSLGGNIAENAGGPHCLAYGTTTNHVLSMEVVLEDGTVVNLGGPTREAPGYDLRGVFVGSEGTFGVATRIVVRLLPLPEVVKTYLGIFPDIDTACTAVSAIIGHGIVPAALEMIDSLSIKAVQSVTDAGYPADGRNAALHRADVHSHPTIQPSDQFCVRAIRSWHFARLIRVHVFSHVRYLKYAQWSRANLLPHQVARDPPPRYDQESVGSALQFRPGLPPTR